MGDPIFYIEIILITVLGLIFGSFATALVHRVPRNRSWGAARSECPECHRKLSVFDLVPVLSWAISGGKCRYCKKKISITYPLTELSCGAMCLMAYCAYGFTIETFLMCLAVPFLVSLIIIDMKYMILPNILVFSLFALGIGRLILHAQLSENFGLEVFAGFILAAFLYAGISWLLGFLLTKVLRKDSLGFGDVKFFAVSGLWLGIPALPYFMIGSGAVAIAFSLLWRALYKTEAFPFGPALIITFYALLLFQGAFV